MIYPWLFFLIGTVQAQEKIRYDGYKLYKIFVHDESVLGSLGSIGDTEGYDFWGQPRLHETADLLVSPEKSSEFDALANATALKYELLTDDLQKRIDDENPRGDLRGTLDWLGYHRLDVIYRYLDSLVGQYPRVVSSVEGGRTYEGREIRGVKLRFKEGNPSVFLEGGIHAREWISPATVTYILNELLTSEDPRVRAVAESYDWYIFPLFNPDGYEFTHTKNRLWRKTRRPIVLGCVGADLNRNWNFHWAESGTSRNPCTETYPGTAAFSEIESRSMAEFIGTVHRELLAYVAFHSYSQLLLIPYGHTSEKIANYDDLMRIGNATIDALRRRYGTKYRVGNIVDLLYKAAGGSADWVRGTYDIPIVYTYELRDTGRHGFILPADYILPTARETLDSLVGMFEEAKALGYGAS